MNMLQQTGVFTATGSDASRRYGCKLALLLIVGLSGCAACHPLRGVPAAYLPEQYVGPSRSGKKTIDLSLLVQRQPDQYRLAAGDILSVYVPGVLGSLRVAEGPEIGETPPINLPQSPDDPPTIGFPTAVRDDGTISLPLVKPINVHGLTLSEAEAAIRDAYTTQANILNDERERVLISLARRREYRVLVVRQETSSELTTGTQPGTLNIGNSKRGTAKVVRLPAYENDVLHALAKAEGGADGLPGLDARNTIYVIRRKGPAVDPIPTAMPMWELLPEQEQCPSEPQFLEADPHEPQAQQTPTPPTLPSAPLVEVPDAYPHAPQHNGPASDPTSTTVNAPAALPQAVAPPVAAEPQLPQISPSPQPESQRFVPAGPAEAPPVPVWPRPAEPAESLRRTSADGPPVWGHSDRPIIRGQSPPDVPLGDSGINGSMTTSPYGQVSRTGASPMIVGPPIATDFGGHDPAWQGYLMDFDPTVDNPNVTKIPIRLGPGERPMFTERDIILQDGDIVFIESRETEVFYTSGLLGGGQYTLPRDYDLGVLEAISIAQSPQIQQNQAIRSVGGVSAMNMDVSFSASHVVILRQLVNGTRMPIEVDLYQALRRPETENILIQPGDIIVLQYTKLEAVGAFIQRHLLEGALFGIAAAQFNNGGGL